MTSAAAAATSLTSAEFARILQIFNKKPTRESNGVDEGGIRVPVNGQRLEISIQASKLVDLSNNYAAIVDGAKDAKKAEPQTSFPCEYCTHVFGTNASLRQHTLLVHHDRCVKCPSCLYVSLGEQSHSLHKCTKGRTLKCALCTELFRSNRDLLQHLKSHRYLHECHLCDNKYTDKNRLSSHIKNCHDKSKSFRCHPCGKSFNYRETFVSHSRVAHSDARPFPCTKCDKRFKTLKSMRVHLRQHEETSTWYHCDTCLHQFAYRSNLVHHRKRHESLKPHSCRLCSKSFVSRFILNRHLRTHDKTKPAVKKQQFPPTFQYFCTHCNKILNSRSSLLSHNAYHTWPKWCPKCAASFGWRTQLERHKRACMSEVFRRPYQCFLCNTRFEHGAALTEHMRRHAKSQFNCLSCNKVFASQSSLRGHTRAVHSAGSIRNRKQQQQMQQQQQQQRLLTPATPLDKHPTATTSTDPGTSHAAAGAGSPWREVTAAQPTIDSSSSSAAPSAVYPTHMPPAPAAAAVVEDLSCLASLCNNVQASDLLDAELPPTLFFSEEHDSFVLPHDML